MIHPSGLFDYVATVGDVQAGGSELAVDAHQAPSRSGPSLAGSTPRIRFWGDQMILIAADRDSLALVKWFRFPAGDVVVRAARPGDALRTIRSGSGGVGLSLFRSDRLVVAVGALTDELLGPAVSIRPLGVTGGFETRFDVSIGGERGSLGWREAATVAGCDVYVEFPGAPGVPGSDATLSVCAADDVTLVNSARRSAVFLASLFFDPLRGEYPDGRYIKES